VKGKVHPVTGQEDPEGEYRYSSTLFFNLGARWVSVVNAKPRLLYSTVNTRYPLYRRLGGPQGWSGRVRKI